MKKNVTISGMQAPFFPLARPVLYNNTAGLRFKNNCQSNFQLQNNMADGQNIFTAKMAIKFSVAKQHGSWPEYLYCQKTKHLNFVYQYLFG